MQDNRFSTTDIYDHDVIIVKRCGSIDKLCFCSSVRQSGWEERGKHSKKGSVNEDKLSNNIIRARNSVKEYALCNPWDFFVTLTLDKKKYNRFDLNKYRKDLLQFINNYSRSNPVKYVFIPELHKNGAWHMHGLIKGISPDDLYINKYGYLSWKQYENKFGFISMSPIKDIEKCASYIAKYISKDLANTIKSLNAHLYYSSQGLKKAERIYKGHASLLVPYEWESPDGLFKIKNFDNRKDNFMDFLDTSYDD